MARESLSVQRGTLELYLIIAVFIRLPEQVHIKNL